MSVEILPDDIPNDLPGEFGREHARTRNVSANIDAHQPKRIHVPLDPSARRGGGLNAAFPSKERTHDPIAWLGQCRLTLSRYCAKQEQQEQQGQRGGGAMVGEGAQSTVTRRNTRHCSRMHESFARTVHRKESAIKRTTKLIAAERAVYARSLFRDNDLPRA